MYPHCLQPGLQSGLQSVHSCEVYNFGGLWWHRIGARQHATACARNLCKGAPCHMEISREPPTNRFWKTHRHRGWHSLDAERVFMGGFRHPQVREGDIRAETAATLKTTQNSQTIKAPQALHNSCEKMMWTITKEGTVHRPPSQAQKLNSEPKAKHASILAVGQAPTVMHHNHTWHTIPLIQGQMGQVEARQHTQRVGHITMHRRSATEMEAMY